MSDELAVKVATVTAEFNQHMIQCNRRYEEDGRWKDRLFTYIKESTEKTDTKIDSAITKIGMVETTMAEARGAGKLGGLLAHGISVLVGGGVIGAIVSFFHK